MSSAGTAMLFVPTQPPLALPPESTVVIGRASDSDLLLDDFDTSRRHAEVSCLGGRYTLRDLGSTNGTYVNGRRVTEHVLQAGDRIGIGESLIAFCLVKTALPRTADDSASTLFREGPAPGWAREAFRGDLAEIPPYALLQILELGNKTGELSIDGDSNAGRIWLKRGTPVHAEAKTQLGFDAALALVLVEAGGFSFEPTLDAPQATIEATVTQLLLEASRILDEEGRELP